MPLKEVICQSCCQILLRLSGNLWLRESSPKLIFIHVVSLSQIAGMLHLEHCLLKRWYIHFCSVFIPSDLQFSVLSLETALVSVNRNAIILSWNIEAMEGLEPIIYRTCEQVSFWWCLSLLVMRFVIIDEVCHYWWSLSLVLRDDCH